MARTKQTARKSKIEKEAEGEREADEDEVYFSDAEFDFTGKDDDYAEEQAKTKDKPKKELSKVVSKQANIQEQRFSKSISRSKGGGLQLMLPKEISEMVIDWNDYLNNGELRLENLDKVNKKIIYLNEVESKKF